MAIGIVILALTRPYEGMLLCLPVAVRAGPLGILWKEPAQPGCTCCGGLRVPLLLVIGAGAWLGYYDYRAFGSPTTLPYTINRATYAVAPYYVWQQPRPEPHYRHEVDERFLHPA